MQLPMDGAASLRPDTAPGADQLPFESQAALRDEPGLLGRRSRSPDGAEEAGLAVDARVDPPLPRRKRRRTQQGQPAGEGPSFEGVTDADQPDSEVPEGHEVEHGEEAHEHGAPAHHRDHAAAEQQCQTPHSQPARAAAQPGVACDLAAAEQLSRLGSALAAAAAAAAGVGARSGLAGADPLLTATPSAAMPPAAHHPHRAQPSHAACPVGAGSQSADEARLGDALRHLGQRLLTLVPSEVEQQRLHRQQQQQQQPADASGEELESSETEAASAAEEVDEARGGGGGGAAGAQPALLPLRPSTPVQLSAGAPAGAGAGVGSAEEAWRRCARLEEELGATRCQLAAAQRALTLAEGGRVALAAELEWEREQGRGTAVQRGAMEVLMAKNTELQEQVRQLSTRQHMVQQQLVAAMAARERRQAEAQQLAADKEGLQQQLVDAGTRQRGLHKQVAALEGRAQRAERELAGASAARDWLVPQLDAALADRARLEEELRKARAELEGVRTKLEAWQAAGARAGW